MQRTYNLQKDTQDIRDYCFVPDHAQLLPSSVDLRQSMPPIYDQLTLGSCTMNAIVRLGEYLQILSSQNVGSYTPLSRLFGYWHERQLEGNVGTDAGALIRDGMKVFNTIGIAPEVDFPYDVTKFAVTPTQQAEADAAAHKIGEYHRVLTYQDVKAALAAGNPVVLGIDVYTSFEGFDASLSGIIPDVDLTKETRLGGHAILAAGYGMRLGTDNVEREYVTIANSWGKEWGDGGYGYLPVSYFTQGLVHDMWIGTNGPAQVKSITFNGSVDAMAAAGIIHSPDFWKSLGEKYAQDNTSDFRYVRQLIINVGASLMQ